MTRRRRAANLMFSAPKTSGFKPTSKGRLVVCSKCGKGGGTLEKVDKGVYKHNKC